MRGIYILDLCHMVLMTIGILMNVLWEKIRFKIQISQVAQEEAVEQV